MELPLRLMSTGKIWALALSTWHLYASTQPHLIVSCLPAQLLHVPALQ